MGENRGSCTSSGGGGRARHRGAQSAAIACGRLSVARRSSAGRLTSAPAQRPPSVRPATPLVITIGSLQGSRSWSETAPRESALTGHGSARCLNRFFVGRRHLASSGPTGLNVSDRARNDQPDDLVEREQQPEEDDCCDDSEYEKNERKGNEGRHPGSVVHVARVDLACLGPPATRLMGARGSAAGNGAMPLVALRAQVMRPPRASPRSPGRPVTDRTTCETLLTFVSRGRVATMRHTTAAIVLVVASAIFVGAMWLAATANGGPMLLGAVALAIASFVAAAWAVCRIRRTRAITPEAISTPPDMPE